MPRIARVNQKKRNKTDRVHEWMNYILGFYVRWWHSAFLLCIMSMSVKQIWCWMAYECWEVKSAEGQGVWWIQHQNYRFSSDQNKCSFTWLHLHMHLLQRIDLIFLFWYGFGSWFSCLQSCMNCLPLKSIYNGMYFICVALYTSNWLVRIHYTAISDFEWKYMNSSQLIRLPIHWILIANFV